MRKDAQKISIVQAPIGIPKEEMFQCAIRDHTLSNYICKFRRQLEKQGIEVFGRKENIIATEQGYYSAMYTDDIRSKEGGIDNPIPFKGKDGRMKVHVIKENGEHSDEDLATLVAMSFCPNPKKYKRVFFRDADSTNCSGDNLFWCSEINYWLLKIFKIKTNAGQS